MPYTITPEPAFLAELRAPSLRNDQPDCDKAFPIGERFRFQIRMAAIAVPNTPVFSPPSTNMSNLATFGVIDSASGSRQMLGTAAALTRSATRGLGARQSLTEHCGLARDFGPHRHSN